MEGVRQKLGMLKNGTQLTWKVAKIKRYSTKIVKRGDWTVPDFFQKLVNDAPGKYLALEGRRMTYLELDRLSNQLAHWFRDQGLGHGSVVPLFMNNCPEYVAIWLGLAKIGAAAALINTNLREGGLVSSLKTAFSVASNTNNSPKIVVVGLTLSHVLTREVQESLLEDFSDISYQTFSTPEWQLERLTGIASETHPATTLSMLQGSLNSLVAPYPKTSLARSIRNRCTYSDPLYYIYTSGTTGFPKAAKVSHLRFLTAGFAFRTLYDYRPDDKMYIPLPLYHSNGGMLGISSSWSARISIVIREKFSATNYFSDCQKYGCTLGVYIGECCRYILNSTGPLNSTATGPGDQSDRVDSHGMSVTSTSPLRMMIGNGLRPEVWEQFNQRFGIKMGEFYGSTEGNANLFNTVGKIGAVGYLPGLLKKIYPVKFLRCDPVSGDVVRDPVTGHCQECHPNEPGELVGLINEHDATRRFDGYTDKGASEKKVLHNVFKTGDSWFRTGDLLKYDQEGFVYFVDRIGDTFRWKSENISTSEVSEVIGKVNGVTDVNVYGVRVEGQEGRAGMAAIWTDRDFSFEKLHESVTRALPVYARPLFVRVMNGFSSDMPTPSLLDYAQNSTMTGTFKHKKGDFQREGFDPELVREPIYFRDDILNEYRLLTPELCRQIETGKVRI